MALFSAPLMADEPMSIADAFATLELPLSTATEARVNRRFVYMAARLTEPSPRLGEARRVALNALRVGSLAALVSSARDSATAAEVEPPAGGGVGPNGVGPSRGGSSQYYSGYWNGYMSGPAFTGFAPEEIRDALRDPLAFAKRLFESSFEDQKEMAQKFSRHLLFARFSNPEIFAAFDSTVHDLLETANTSTDPLHIGNLDHLLLMIEILNLPLIKVIDNLIDSLDMSSHIWQFFFRRIILGYHIRYGLSDTQLKKILEKVGSVHGMMFLLQAVERPLPPKMKRQFLAAANSVEALTYFLHASRDLTVRGRDRIQNMALRQLQDGQLDLQKKIQLAFIMVENAARVDAVMTWIEEMVQHTNDRNRLDIALAIARGAAKTGVLTAPIRAWLSNVPGPEWDIDGSYTNTVWEVNQCLKALGG